MSAELPFDVSYHFDANLRDVPNAPGEMAQAVRLLRARLNESGLAPRERTRLLGQIGVFCRMLGELAAAREYLEQAVALAVAMGDTGAALANGIRLAHVYQWQRDFARSNAAFSRVLATIEANASLERYRDFALQHAGKNLFDQSRYTEASALFREALAIRQAKGDAELINSTQQALDAVERRLR